MVFILSNKTSRGTEKKKIFDIKFLIYIIVEFFRISTTIILSLIRILGFFQFFKRPI